LNSLSDEIKHTALKLGFEQVGISSADPLLEAGRQLREYLNDGRHGSMNWLSDTASQRSDPKAFFPEAASVVMTATNYFQKQDKSIGPDHTGNISLYARGRDYHRVIRHKLKQLLHWISQQEPHTKGRIFVDSFPLMEKPLAVRAGLGWIAKNTTLILKKKGSFFFLGGILLNLPLPTDPPFSDDYCGKCNRCQIACPTQALATPFQIDSRKCLSYLTIEHAGEIEPEYHTPLQNFIFGCDICQLVCPWNQKYARDCREKDFADRYSSSQLLLENLSKMTAQQYNIMFEGTAVRRLGYKRFKRNVEIAWQNLNERDQEIENNF
jgi:epoxyqueuosine reductase